jgi:hypothetical protein
MRYDRVVAREHLCVVHPQEVLLKLPAEEGQLELETISWHRHVLKIAASLFATINLQGILHSAVATSFSTGRNANAQEDKDNMRARESVIPAWLKRQVGFQLAHEQFTVPELVELGIAADQAGFDLLAVSDHFRPWQANEGHSGQAWITMAAIGQRTQRVRMGTTVTCPTFRYSPAVVAEAFASLNLAHFSRSWFRRSFE